MESNHRKAVSVLLSIGSVNPNNIEALLGLYDLVSIGIVSTPAR